MMNDGGGGANATLDGGLDSPSLADTCILVSICLMGTEVMMVAPGGDAVSPAKTQACQVPRFSGAGWRRHGAGMDGPCISPTLLFNNAMSSAPWDGMAWHAVCHQGAFLSVPAPCFFKSVVHARFVCLH